MASREELLRENARLRNEFAAYRELRTRTIHRLQAEIERLKAAQGGDHQ